MRVLVTGSAGLVGTALLGLLGESGFDASGLDLKGSGPAYGDVRCAADVRRRMAGCDGVVHLAAVSRVIWGERDPEACRATNVGGLRNVIRVARGQPKPPWVIFVSSREVYGQPAELPATEESPLRPVNVYGETKVEGERLTEEAGRSGLRACIVRLSNVFGSVHDHADRVVPAFARGAVMGAELQVEGADHTFDFTHLDDVVRGLTALARRLSDGAPATPPIHFVSGQPTTLSELAGLAIELAESRATTRCAPPRDFDVARFYGSPERAAQILDWRPRVSLREGLARLISDYRGHLERHGARA